MVSLYATLGPVGLAVVLGVIVILPFVLKRLGGWALKKAFSVPFAAKGAVLMLTKTAAAEYAARGIRVNAICPGAIRTAITDSLPEELIQGVINLTPMARFADPSEVANLAVFLASDESSFMTGSAVLIDGGYTTL